MSLLENPNESPVDKDRQDRDLKIVANIKDKNEKLAWTRRQKKIEEMVEEMRPLDDELMAIIARRQEYLDKIQALRRQMVKECIHPRNSLVHKDTFIECKFCNAKLSIPRVRND